MKLALTIDGHRVEASADETLLEVLDRIGKHVPPLCHLPDLKPYGACRLCLVQQVWPGGSRMVTACDLVARAGGRFVTDSDAVKRMRKLVVELHLARCPDVPEIRAKARELGVRTLRFRGLDDTCILCGLCERVCREVVGASALAFEGRGGTRRITASYGEIPSECIGCGACSFVCPTGAIRMDHAALAKLRTLPGSQRPCRHALTGLYPSALCSHSYECVTCEVDERLRDVAQTHPVLAMRGGKAARTFVMNLLAIRGKSP